MDLSRYKASTFANAAALGLPADEDLLLVPIGDWILTEPDLIAKMAQWRQASMDMFFAQFESTPAKTLGYLKAASIGQANRLLFVILEAGQIVGHVGFSNASSESAELDNVMRGIRSENLGLMAVAINALVTWGFGVLGLESVTLKVSSINAKAIALYERCGFEVTGSVALRRTENNGEVLLSECTDAEADVPQRSLTMTRVR